MPTRVTPRSQTLTDNIFSNIIEEDIISDNITTTISDHYIQFILFKNQIKSKTNIKKANFERSYKSLNKDLFEYDLKNTKWDEILNVNRGDTDYSFETFLNAPNKKLSIQEVKLSKKPLITTGTLTSIKNKNRIHRKVVRAKDPVRKTDLENKYIDCTKNN